MNHTAAAMAKSQPFRRLVLVLDVQRRHVHGVDAKEPKASVIERQIAQPDHDAGTVDRDKAKRRARAAGAIDRDRLRDSRTEVKAGVHAVDLAVVGSLREGVREGYARRRWRAAIIAVAPGIRHIADKVDPGPG
jgi:hypothetical protein